MTELQPRPIAVLVVPEGRETPAFVAELARDTRFRAAGRASSIEVAAAAAREHEVDVVVAEIRTVERFGQMVELEASLRPTGLVVVTPLPHEVALLTALAAGVRGFLHDPPAPGLVAAAVAAVAEGHTFVDPRSTGPLVELALRGPLAPAGDGLSFRQAQVVHLVRAGLTNRQIGGLLGISLETVKSHLQEAMRRLEAHDRWDATVLLDERQGAAR